MPLQTPPIAKAQMLIRRPVAEVFNAFIDPAITTKFWFTKSSGKLEPGKEIRWDWEMYGHSTHLRVQSIEPPKRILIEWTNHGHPCPVEWLFTPRPDHTTFVTVSNWGFTGTDDEQVTQALDSTGGFNLVLAAAKALLEHHLQLNLVPDHSPKSV